MDSSCNLVIFTDLDGTLLDRTTYSYTQALPAVELLLRRKIPLIFCSAKTRAEQEVFRTALKICDPFIVEDGGAIFIPPGYFSVSQSRTVGNYEVIELGRPYSEIRAVLERVKSETGIDFRGFGTMSTEEVAVETGLDLELARKAKQREYSETLILNGTDTEILGIIRAIQEAGLSCTHGGSYYEITGGNDKGKAAVILNRLFVEKLGRIKTVGIGDSQNDLSLLGAVDIPILVQKPGGWWEEMKLPNIHRIEGIGPAGWRLAIQSLVD